ncbi:4-coumarate--CoA ligase family protein [Nocardioides antri]|uniref:4-coumarate--CoA ligase family protein n=1 Tax=Nocardioides antri TaxID=2607659 RepID=A0A5B1M079_9ACTN|nr:4-coumarate--CoA ligase family protein [Nocardioides antri]
MPFKSPFPDVEIPDVTVYDFLFGDLTEEESGRVAVFDSATGSETTYGDLRARIDAFAGALAARGIKPGDVVALHVPNTAAFVIAFHGILRAGATATTINSLYTPPEIANQLRDSGAVRYVTVSLLLPGALAGCAEVDLPPENVVVLDGAEGHESLMDLLSEGAAPPDVSIDPATHLAVLPYSSGTTGKAKGVMLTHRNLVANVLQSMSAIPERSDDVVLAVLPFFHIYGMNVIMSITLKVRAKLVTMPKFDLDQFLRLIHEQRITFLYIAPPMAVALAKHPAVDDIDTSSVRAVLSGAAPLDEALGQAVKKRLGCGMQQGYGMTELSPVSHALPLDREDISIGSVGLAVANVEFKVVDTATGEEIEAVPGGRTAPGELWVRGPGVMVGYLGNEEATQETIDADGYLHTGDIVEVGPEGEVYVVDRLKELIKYKGYQVPPAELEAVLLTHPDIADAAVVPHPDDDAGEVPHAFVVLQQGASLTAEDVIAYVGEKVAPHKKVRVVDFIPAIPKSASGKILRKDLKGKTAADFS